MRDYKPLASQAVAAPDLQAKIDVLVSLLEEKELVQVGEFAQLLGKKTPQALTVYTKSYLDQLDHSVASLDAGGRLQSYADLANRLGATGH